jgi:branched-chain polyamine synthase A-like protein
MTVVERFRRGDRLDDVLRSATTIATGMWQVIEYLRSLDDASFLPGAELADRPRAVGASLVDLALADGLLDWSAMRQVIGARGYAPELRYFQSFDTFDTLRRRAAIMHAYGDLAGRSILVLGDDELFGVALALSDGVRRTDVLDVDGRIVDRQNAESERRNLRLTAHRIDVLRDELPTVMADVFFVSGLKDAGGLRAFAGAGVLGTGPGAVGYVSADLDVLDSDASPAANLRVLLGMFENLDCEVTALLPCDELALSDQLIERMQTIMQRCAHSRASFQSLSDSLAALAEDTSLDLVTRKRGFPHIPLDPALLARVVVGAGSMRRAQRDRRMLAAYARRRSVVPQSGDGASATADLMMDTS